MNEQKHTPGPWTAIRDHDYTKTHGPKFRHHGITIHLYKFVTYEDGFEDSQGIACVQNTLPRVANVSASASVEEIEANAYLIAAAPKGLDVAEHTYLWFLGQEYPCRPQEIMCELRDFIAEATDRSSKDVQNHYQAMARRGEQ